MTTTTAATPDLTFVNARESPPLWVALLGYGCLGGAVAGLLWKMSATDVRVEVVRALVRDVEKERPDPPPPGFLTKEFAAIVGDPSIELVVEGIGGLTPTKRYVEALLQAGEHVVSANKQLLAHHLHDLTRLAHQNGVFLRFEAAAGGAVPVVRTVCEALPPGSVRRIAGILNGTTNYVFSRVEESATFAEALDEARRLGYAEADADDDLTGRDPAAEIAILATLAFGRQLSLDEVDQRGIEGLTEEDIAAACARRRRIRLVSEATLRNGVITARVCPVALSESDPLARVPAADNESSSRETASALSRYAAPARVDPRLQLLSCTRHCTRRPARRTGLASIKGD